MPPTPEDDEALPDRELNLDGMAPPPLMKLHKRLARRSELLKLHLKHYHMSPAQFRRQTSDLYLPEGVDGLYDGVVKPSCARRPSQRPQSQGSLACERRISSWTLRRSC